MGLCISLSQTKSITGGDRQRLQLPGNSNQSIRIIHVDGRIQELKEPVKAKTVTSQNPNCFLCNSESMSIGTHMPHAPDHEDLQLGQIYFLIPLSKARDLLSLTDLCSLAVKASGSAALPTAKFVPR